MEPDIFYLLAFLFCPSGCGSGYGFEASKMMVLREMGHLTSDFDIRPMIFEITELQPCLLLKLQFHPSNVFASVWAPEAVDFSTLQVSKV